MSSAMTAFHAADAEPEFTTWKTRDGKTSKHTIDYILYSNEESATDAGGMFFLQPVQAWDIFPQVASPLPNAMHPSDHLALCVSFLPFNL